MGNEEEQTKDELREIEPRVAILLRQTHHRKDSWQAIRLQIYHGRFQLHKIYEVRFEEAGQFVYEAKSKNLNVFRKVVDAGTQVQYSRAIYS